MIPLKDDNPTTTTPFVTVGLVAINVAVFVYELMLPPEALETFVYKMAVIPAEVTQGVSLGPHLPVGLTLLTSMFLHGGPMHLVGNMLYLWIFGNNVEDQTGHLRFVLFYLICGLAAAGTQILVSPSSQVPMIGASGAIAGVLGAYMLLFPHARVLTLIPIFIFIRLVYLPAALMLGFWFVYQLLLSGIGGPPEGGGVAFFAHIGGFVAGMILIWIFRRRRARRARRWQREQRWEDWGA